MGVDVSLSKEREKELRALVAETTKDLDLAPGDIVLGADIATETPRTSTGILALDVALGGGLPLDQWTEIVGHESSGKTATTMQIVAQQQRMYPDWVCAWVAAEAFDAEFALMNGLDLDRILLIPINAMEEAFEAVIRAMERRAVDGVVIDSFPALVPTGEYAREMMDGQQPGVGAKLFNQFFRKIQKAARRSLITEDRHWLGIIINQWREQIGISFGDPRTTPGGKGKNYSYYVRIEVAREEWIDNGLTKRDKVIVGQKIRLKIFKNKSGPPQRVCHYDLYVDNHKDFEPGDIDVVADIFNTAEALGVVGRAEEGTSYFVLSSGEKIGGNRPASLKKLATDPELAETVQREVLATMSRKVPAAPPLPKPPPKKTTSRVKVKRS